MVSTFTTNKSLEKPATGDQVGTWGSNTVNPNMDKLDSCLGGVATIALTNSPVTLSSGQYVNTFIRFTGAITANIAITFPAVGSFYTIINDCTNSSAFYVTATTTAAGGRVIGLPSGSMTQMMTDGTNCRYSTLPPVGTLWEFGGSSVPAWVSACTVPPWVSCNGTAFSSATYPALTALLGGTTPPDLRGRYRVPLNDGTGRITSGSGVDGNTNLATGGSQQSTPTITQANIPNYNLTVTDPGHTHTYTRTSGVISVAAGGGGAQFTTVGDNVGTSVTGISVNSAGSGTGMSFTNLPPTQVVGITMIRAG